LQLTPGDTGVHGPQGGGGAVDEDPEGCDDELELEELEELGGQLLLLELVRAGAFESGYGISFPFANCVDVWFQKSRPQLRPRHEEPSVRGT